jgi:hypothetical protein
MGGGGASHGDRRLARLPVRRLRPRFEPLVAAREQADAANEIAECHANLVNLRFGRREVLRRTLPMGGSPQDTA